MKILRGIERTSRIRHKPLGELRGNGIRYLCGRGKHIAIMGGEF